MRYVSDFISRVFKANERELYKVITDEVLLELCEEIINFVIEKQDKKESYTSIDAYKHIVSRMKKSCPDFDSE